MNPIEALIRALLSTLVLLMFAGIIGHLFWTVLYFGWRVAGLVL